MGSQAFTEAGAGAFEARLDGADLDFQYGRNFGQGQLFIMGQDEGFTLGIGQFSYGLNDGLLGFAGEEIGFGRAIIDGIGTGISG